MSLLNTLLKPYGLKAVKRRPAAPAAEDIRPLERNEKRTLDKLWADASFKERYENNHQGLYRGLMAIVGAENLLPREASVIDVGCGPGYFLEMIERGGHQGPLSGCDFSESAIQSAGERCRAASLFVHDVYTPLPKSHDVLFCMETIEHLLHPGKALANLLAASRTTVITVPEGRKDTFLGHINFWSPESWEVFCQEHAAGRRVSTRVFNDGKNLLAIFSVE